MKNITLKIRNVALLGFCLITVSCTSVKNSQVIAANPDQRLDQMLALYENTQAMGDGCHEIWRANNATLDCQRVMNEIERLYVEFPNHPRIILANAIVNYDMERPDKAQWLLDQLSLFRNANPEAAMLRAEIALSEGNVNFADDLIERQVLLVPDNSGLREMQASIAYLSNEYDDARQALSIAGRLGAPGWRISYHHGLLSEAQQQWEQACNFYMMSLTQKADFQSALSRLIGLIDHVECEEGVAYIN